MKDLNRPKKEDYDFNDNIEGVRYAKDINDYADKLEEQLRLYVVSNSIAKEYAEFCVRCDREGLPLLELEDYIKHYCC
jgi:hypothetical protein